MRFRFWHTGIWAVEAWLYYMVTFVSMPLSFTWRYPYLVCLLAMLVLAVFAMLMDKRAGLYERIKSSVMRASLITSFLASAGTLTFGLTAAFPQMPPGVALIGMGLGAYYAGYSLVKWATLYSSANMQSVVLLVFVQSIIASCVTAILSVVPQPAALFLVAALPVASELMFIQSEKKPLTGNVQPTIFSAKQYGEMWRIWIALIGIAVILGVLASKGQGQIQEPPFSTVFAQKAILVIFDLSFIAYVLQSNNLPSFTVLWKTVIVVLGGVILAVTVLPGSFVFDMLITTLSNVLHIFLLITFCDIVGRTSLRNPNNFAIMGLLLCAYFSAVVLATPLSYVLFPHLTLAQTAPYLFFALVVIVASSWGTSDLAMRVIFEDLEHDNPGSGDGTNIQASVFEMAHVLYGLTDRETEVLELLYQGRTRAYIAECLFVSEDTVKTHVSHIYRKVGAHSKKELRETIDRDCAEAAGLSR